MSISRYVTNAMAVLERTTPQQTNSPSLRAALTA